MFFKKTFHQKKKKTTYAYAQDVFQSFEMVGLGDYNNLYTVIGVLLLANVFQSFRGIFIEYYGLDLAHVYTAPWLE